MGAKEAPVASIRKTRSGTWQVYWREPVTARQVSRNVSSHAEARTFRAEVEVALQTGRYVAQEAREALLADYLGAMVAELPWRPQSRRNWELALAKHLVPRVGGLRLVDVSPAHVRALLAGVDGSGWTKALCYDVLSRGLRMARSEGLLFTDPLQGVKRPSHDSPVVRTLEPRTVEALAAAITPRYRLVVLL